MGHSSKYHKSKDISFFKCMCYEAKYTNFLKILQNITDEPTLNPELCPQEEHCTLLRRSPSHIFYIAQSSPHAHTETGWPQNKFV